MDPVTISASALDTYEACSARYKAEYIARAPSTSGAAAQLGTVVHAALEAYIKGGLHLTGGTAENLHAFLETAWWDEFNIKDPQLFAEGEAMLTRWWRRNQDWSNREVLMTEVKERFELPIPGGDPVPVTYIWDRCDRHSDGSIEVVDYKTYGTPLPVDALKERIQARLYALAAFIKYKDDAPPTIWVTYDLLRYDAISVAYTRDECVQTWRYLQKTVQRIREDDGSSETLNSTCRWCARQGVCNTLQRAAEYGNPLATTDINEAAERRDAVDAAVKALTGQRDELDSFIKEFFEENAISPKEGITTPKGVQVTIKGRMERKFPQQRVAKILGPDLMGKYGYLKMADIDKLLETDVISQEQKNEIKGLITETPSRIWVSTRKHTPKEGE